MSANAPGASWISVLGPGLLVAATGVGAGDLMTAGFAGSHLGTAVLWAVVLGGVLKFTLTEGLARYQLATGRTLLEGSVREFGKPIHLAFLVLYVLPWTIWVGSALMSACGVAAHALFPVFETPERGKVVFGMLHSAIGVVLVWRGGFRFFERFMSLAVGLMFACVIVTAVLLAPLPAELLTGLFVPRIPDADGAGLGWTVALLGGVGGTLSILCYGYWIREHGREGLEHARTCRIDLGVGYVATCLFGLAMVVIGSRLEIEGRGASLLPRIADQLEEPLGRAGRILFLIGAWCAVLSSLLGVWQAIPILFADLWSSLFGATRGGVSSGAHSRVARAYLIGIATLPALGLFFGFEAVQKLYAVVGAWFMPILAVVLLALLRSPRRVPAEARLGLPGTLGLLLTLGFFAYAALRPLFS